MRQLLVSSEGFSLTEIIVALGLIGILVGPLSIGLTSLVASVAVREELTAECNAARGKMEEVLAMGFDNIPLSSPTGTPNALSDQVTIRGRSVERQVIVDLADGDLPPDGDVDSDFKHITVKVGNFALVSYLSAEP